MRGNDAVLMHVLQVLVLSRSLRSAFQICGARHESIRVLPRRRAPALRERRRAGLRMEGPRPAMGPPPPVDRGRRHDPAPRRPAALLHDGRARLRGEGGGGRQHRRRTAGVDRRQRGRHPAPRRPPALRRAGRLGRRRAVGVGPERRPGAQHVGAGGGAAAAGGGVQRAAPAGRPAAGAALRRAQRLRGLAPAAAPRARDRGLRQRRLEPLVHGEHGGERGPRPRRAAGAGGGARRRRPGRPRPHRAHVPRGPDKQARRQALGRGGARAAPRRDARRRGGPGVPV